MSRQDKMDALLALVILIVVFAVGFGCGSVFAETNKFITDDTKNFLIVDTDGYMVACGGDGCKSIKERPISKRSLNDN